MGKYAATRAFRNDRERTVDSSSDTWASVGSYLLDRPTSGSQFKTQMFLYSLDPTGIYTGYLNYRDNNAYWSDYLNNTGLDWTDILYPTRTLGHSISSGSVVRSGFSFVSKNINRLYR